VLELRIRNVVEQIANAPESAPRGEQRPGMRVIPLVRYPFKIFYRIVGDTVRIYAHQTYGAPALDGGRGIASDHPRRRAIKLSSDKRPGPRVINNNKQAAQVPCVGHASG